MNFKQLCNDLELRLETDLSDVNQRLKIEHWCQTKIASHLQFEGTEKERFQSYLALAQFYLDTFLQHPTVHLAASRGFDKYLEKKSPLELDQVDEHGLTALHCAAQEGQVETTKLLLSRGANPLIRSQQLQMPIDFALRMSVFSSLKLRHRKIDIARLLVASARDMLNHIDMSGDTVLHRMAAQGFFELIDETLKIKPDLLRVANKHGHYPIHTAVLNRQVECVRILMGYPGVESQMDAEQQTPLEYAFKLNAPDLMDLCVRALTDMNRRNSFGETPLFLAAGAGNLTLFQELLVKGANINAVDFDGNTILHRAVLSGHIDMVSWLLAHADLDPFLSNKKGQTPLDVCKNEDIRRLFSARNGAGMTSL